MWGWLGSLSQQSANTFHYTPVGEPRSSLNSKSIWKLHDGRNEGDGSPVSIFVFEKTGAPEDLIKLARSSFFRLKTLRHPNILRYVDGVELDAKICVVTEPVTPLEEYLADNKGNVSSQVAISWGLHQIVKGVGFLNMDCKICHSALCMAAVFVDAAGEWKIGGVDYLHAIGEAQPEPVLTYLKKYQPPGAKGAETKVQWATDVWGLGCLIWEVFNQPLPQLSSLKTVAKIPKNLIAAYCELVSANPCNRPNPTAFLAACRKPGGYMANDFVDVSLQLEEVQILDAAQKEALFAKLKDCVDSFPEPFNRYKVLPILLQAFEFGEAGSAVLAPLFKLGKLLESAEYQQKIVPCVVKLFSSTDRGTRINLLQQLDLFVEHLQPNIVNEKIFQHVALGFSDTVAVMREHTIKSMLLLAPKLNEKTMNGELLRHFAKLQMDEQPGIRTNTTICLGKLAPYLNSATRNKVLLSAFTRALRDPFPPARLASVRAMLACVEYFKDDDIAVRLLPAICPLMVDKEKPVREAVLEVAGGFLKNLSEASEKRAASATSAEGGADQGGLASSGMVAAGSAASWAGWAVTSLTAKIYKPDGTAVDGAGRIPTAAAAGAATSSASPQSRPSKSVASASSADKPNSSVQSPSSGAKPYRMYGGRAEDEDEDASWDDGDDENWESIEDSFTATPSQPAQSSSKSQKDSLGHMSSLPEDTKGKTDDVDDSGAWDDDGWGSFDSTPKPASMGSKKSTARASATTKGSSTRNSSTAADVSRSSSHKQAAASSSSMTSNTTASSGWGDDGENGGWGDDDADWGASLEDTTVTSSKKSTTPAAAVAATKKSTNTSMSSKGAMSLQSSSRAARSSAQEGFVKDDSMPTAAGLFSSTPSSSSPATGSKTKTTGVSAKKSTTLTAEKSPATQQVTSGGGDDGWGDAGEWGDLGDGATAEVTTASSDTSAADRNALREQRRAEQRKRQEAAKAKRAAAAGAKGSKLGGAMKLS